MDAMSGNDVDIDEDGKVAVHGATIAVWTTKIPGEGRDSLTDIEKPT